MMWSLVAGCGLALILLVTGAGGQTCTTLGTNFACVKCAAFHTYQPTTRTCLAPTAASSCPSNCATCPGNNTVCVTCNPGYRLKNGACELCQAHNCKVCHATCIDRCEECLAGFRRNKDYKCERCNGLCKNCTSSAAGCDECGAATYADASAKCDSCTDVNCDVCTSPATCVKCKAAHFLTGATCTSCSGGCLACSSATTCTQCPAGQYWDGTAKTCTACNANCKTNKCDLNSKCTECKNGYFVNAGSCTERLNCKVADASGKCTECNDNFKLVGGNCEGCLELTPKECHSCVDGNRRRLWTNGLCQYCPTNCNKCNTTTNCQSCNSDYIWNTTTSACTACPTGDSSLTVAECALCSTSYYSSGCKACPSTGADPAGVGMTACEGCKGVAWTQNCTACEASTLASLSSASCAQCAAAKTGIFFSSTCQQYNCSDKKTVDSCAACGVSNQLVQCQACPADLTSLSTPAECEQCTNAKWILSGTTARCIDTTKLDCSGNLNNTDETTCLYCNSHFWNNVTTECQICTGTLNQEACVQCPGRYWDTDCKTFDCKTVTTSTPVAQCNACNFDGKYYNGTFCLSTTCSSVSGTDDEKMCNACDGVMWNGTLCIAATAGPIMGEEACRYFSGREWAGTTTCNSIPAAVGESTSGTVATTYTPPLYRTIDGKYASAVCNEFDTVEECSKCTGQYWDSGTSKCKAVDCSGTLATESECKSCTKRYWDTDCKTLGVACSTSLTSKIQCEACRFDNYYWDGTNCKQSACTNLVGSTSQSECEACEEVYWNGTLCNAATSGNLTHTEELCEGFFARVFVNSACKVVSSKVGATIDSDISAGGNEFHISGDRFFDAANKIYRIPDTAAAKPYQFTDNWCRYSSSKYSQNYYWETTALDSFCLDLAGLGVCGTTANAGYVRNLHPDICGKCPGFLWDATNNVCNAVACADPTTITSSADCAACGQGYVWENNFFEGDICRKLTCTSDLLGSAARCTACSISGSPKNLQSSSDCYACTATNCEKCNVEGCIKCKHGYVLDAKANTCTACATGQVFDPVTQACKTCPANCMLCSSSTACMVCKAGYVLRNGGCVACGQTEADCRDCKSATTNRGSRWDAAASPKCIVCPAGCTSCDSSGCNVCLDGFYKDGTTCKACPAPKLITTEATCLECFKETYHAAATGCTDCLVQYCKTCTAGTCTECNAGRYLKSNKCELCSPTIHTECATCTNTGTCTKCNANFYVGIDKTSCKSKHAQCITHTNEKGCTLCQDGYYITGETCTQCQTGCAKCSKAGTCEECQANYFITPLKYCAKCIDNCDVCECNAKCDRCATGYCFDVNNLECIQESTLNCKECTKSGTTISCVTCKDKYVKDVCPACTHAACTACTAANTCTACLQGYRVDSNSCTACTDTNCKECTATDCTTCKDNYFKSNGTCTQCGLNCKTCLNDTTCTECFGGYSLTAGTCSSCTTNCVDCKQECLTCATGYIPDANTKQCVPVPTTTTATPPNNSPPAHQMALATLLMTLLLTTMIII